MRCFISILLLYTKRSTGIEMFFIAALLNHQNSVQVQFVCYDVSRMIDANSFLSP